MTPLEVLEFVQQKPALSLIGGSHAFLPCATGGPQVGDVIAIEDQGLWEAVLAEAGDVPAVRFLVDDRRQAVDAGMELDEFLVRMLAVAAAHPADLRCRLHGRPPDDATVLPKVTVVPGVVRFDHICAGPGWVGVIWSDRMHVHSEVAPASLIRQLPRWTMSWEQLSDGAGPPAGNIWGLHLAGGFRP